MGKVNIRINVDLTNSEGETEAHQVEVEAELPESGPKLIDNVERAILELNKDAIRQAVVAYFEDLSKKKPEKSKEIMAALSEQILPRIESMEK
jgi:acyl-CoA reductase-like NAD-dependent aldehyde dehydrogenase